jgi:hypothetical protein
VRKNYSNIYSLLKTYFVCFRCESRSWRKSTLDSRMLTRRSSDLRPRNRFAGNLTLTWSCWKCSCKTTRSRFKTSKSIFIIYQSLLIEPFCLGLFFHCRSCARLATRSGFQSVTTSLQTTRLPVPRGAHWTNWSVCAVNLRR